MSLDKITEQQTTGKWIDDLADTPELGTDAMQQAFDYISRSVIIPAFNALIDALSAVSGAKQVGATVPGVAGTDIAAILTELKTLLDNRYTKTESDTLVSSGTNDLVKTLDFNLNTGVITVTKKDGTVQIFDTPLEKVPASFDLVELNGSVYLKITNVDKTSTQTDITALMNLYTFDSSAQMAFTVTGTGNAKTVTATIRDGSLGIEKLSLSAVTQLEGYVSASANSASAAEIAKTAANSAAGAAQTAKTAAETARNGAQTAESAALNSKTAAENSAAAAAASASGAASDAVTAANEANRSKREADRATAIVGGDYATKAELNTALSTKIDKITGKSLSTEDYSTAEKSKLAGLANYDDTTVNASIAAAKTALNTHTTDTEQHITAAERQAWNGKAAPSRGVAAALTAAGWVGSAAPFTQAITVSGVTAACSGSVGLGAATNAEQYTAAATAMLLLTGQAADQITVTAFGEKPTVDLPILITIVG